MAEYFFDIEFNDLLYDQEELNYKEFESCIFNNCNFSACNFLDVTFIECVFNGCILNKSNINHVALRTVTFNFCEIKEVNFAMCSKLIFEIRFNHCLLDFSKFYALKMKRTPFINCSMIAVDFMATDLTEVVFENCDLYRAEFTQAIANKANFKTSHNYTIDPKKTKLKKAIFGREGLKGLLYKHDLIIH